MTRETKQNRRTRGRDKERERKREDEAQDNQMLIYGNLNSTPSRGTSLPAQQPSQRQLCEVLAQCDPHLLILTSTSFSSVIIIIIIIIRPG